ncbi:hypothetical protein HF086_014466 [Spodoptera exigua]|uniref:Uncharacterized protein n=1 Tax=Spodoptera exigua TaxID=7107 RepID=A0A922SJR7_SPOEX|nr:hypothetical protein HF086_014466 [Spodoptera exigua]
MVDTMAAPTAAATVYTRTVATHPSVDAALVGPCQDRAVDSLANQELIAVQWPNDDYALNRNAHLAVSLLTFVTLSAISLLWFLTEYIVLSNHKWVLSK